MRVTGIDIAKAGYCAAALAKDGKPIKVTAWTPRNPKDSEPEQLDQFSDWVDRQLWFMNPDIVVVEELAVFLNKKVIRTLSRREGVALQRAKRYVRRNGGIVLHPPVTQSRSIVLGPPGNMKKEEAWKRIKKKYPDFDFGHAANDGGMDKGDAMTHALAGPIILERR